MQTQSWAPPPAPAPPVMSSMPIGPRPSNGTLILFFVLAAVLLLTGAVLLQAMSISERPNQAGYTDYAQYILAVESWQRGLRLQAFIGSLFLDVGVFLFVMGGFMGAIARGDLPEGVRRVMIVMPVVLAIVWLVGFFLLGTAMPLRP